MRRSPGRIDSPCRLPLCSGWPKSALLGWLAAMLLAFFVLLLPAHATLRALWLSFPAGGARRRAGWGMAAAIGLCTVLLALPVPSTVTVQGVVWPPEQATVRAGTEGFVAEVLARDGQPVEVGSAILALAEPGLLAERDALRARLLGLGARQYDAILREPSQARNVIEELEHARAELERVERRIGEWTVRSKVAGRLVLPHAEDLPGRFVKQGGTLAHVLMASPAMVRAAVSQDHATRLRGSSARIEVRLAEDRAPVPAHLAREVPAATRTLPSAALGEPGGGAVLVEPGDKDGTRALEPVFLCSDVGELGEVQDLVELRRTTCRVVGDAFCDVEDQFLELSLVSDHGCHAVTVAAFRTGYEPMFV